MNSAKELSCNNFSRNNKLSRRLNKVLRSIFGLKAHVPLDIYLKSGGDKVTINQLVRMLKALKKDGYTLEQIITLLEYITATNPKYEGK